MAKNVIQGQSGNWQGLCNCIQADLKRVEPKRNTGGKEVTGRK